jgi:putative DNA primase/helicase
VTVRAFKATRDLRADEIQWGSDTPSESERLTEAGAAERFARLHGDDLRYDHQRGHWLLWDLHRWKRDADAAVTRLAIDFARDWQREAVEITDRDRREAVFKAAIRLERRDALFSMLALARDLKPIADAGGDWDRDPRLLGCPNGVLDLRTGKLSPGRREDRITMSVAVPFDEQAACPRFERFLLEICGGDRVLAEYLHCVSGYCLTANIDEQVMWMLYGLGANGKSTLLKILLKVWGDYGDTAAFATFERASARGSIPNDLAALNRKRLVVASETREGAHLDEGRLKSLTGGDPIRARFLNQEWFTFEPTLKLMLCVNHRPVATDDSFGFWRRVKLVPFEQRFSPDATLADALLDEAAGILRWAVHGCLEWQAVGLTHPQRVENATHAYAADSDPLAAFIEEACELDPDAEIGAADFYAHYLQWSEREHLGQRERLSSTAFGRRMKTKFTRIDSAQRTYRGVARKVGL